MYKDRLYNFPEVFQQVTASLFCALTIVSVCLTGPETEIMQQVFIDFKEHGEFHVPMHQSPAAVFEIVLPRTILFCLVAF